MKYTYEIIVSDFDNSEVLKRTDKDGGIAWIPMVAGNADYEEYLNPKAEQSTPIETGDE
jgi:hypothetical protein